MSCGLRWKYYSTISASFLVIRQGMLLDISSALKKSSAVLNPPGAKISEEFTLAVEVFTDIFIYKLYIIFKGKRK